MKVLMGVDPHKASLAVAAVHGATGELLESAPPSHRTAPALGPSNAGREGSQSGVGRWRTPVASG